MKGRIFNIQRFSVHDGPGIRTTVFFKGCNLRCQWCHNPESYETKVQMQYFADKCVGCRMCEQVCPQGVKISGNRRIGMENCILCKRCESVCMQDAIKVSGYDIEAEQLLETVKKDRRYYDNSGGGLTVSGGEPMLQWEFLKVFLPMVREAGITIALDTAGDVPLAWYQEIVPLVDLVLLDLKIMDSALHKKYTGVDNKRILENARWMMEHGVRLHIRVPLMAGLNDTDENFRLLKEFLDGASSVEEIRLLPYHAMGLNKAESLEIEEPEFTPPSPDRMEALRAYLGDRAVI
ncbi:MAG: glycyl-radical enzyme activating protein [Blautia sp.]|jgi:glycyl-radical enzyme activating protein